jgi:hypothetical protein
MWATEIRVKTKLMIESISKIKEDDISFVYLCLASAVSIKHEIAQDLVQLKKRRRNVVARYDKLREMSLQDFVTESLPMLK